MGDREGSGSPGNERGDVHALPKLLLEDTREIWEI
jgi:hypothetical protein